MLEKFEGCLIGLAVGDALGMPVEGLSSELILKRYGKVEDFLPAPHRRLSPGQFTDDTQMMIIHAESIVEKGRVDPEDLAVRFIRWLREGSPRGIGLTTLSAIKRLMQGVSWEESGEGGEHAAGNGVAMRIAPVGLLNAWTPERLREDVEKAGIITHRNPEALKGGLAVAYAVAKLASGTNLDGLLEDVCEFVGACRVTENIQKAGKLLREKVEPEQALKILGTSGYVVETVASAFYCFLRTPEDFKASVITAVMGGNDADTTAAITGALSGAFNGFSAIPERWVERLEQSHYIKSLARSIYELALNRIKG